MWVSRGHLLSATARSPLSFVVFLGKSRLLHLHQLQEDGLVEGCRYHIGVHNNPCGTSFAVLCSFHSKQAHVANSTAHIYRQVATGCSKTCTVSTDQTRSLRSWEITWLTALCAVHGLQSIRGCLDAMHVRLHFEPELPGVGRVSGAVQFL